MTADHGTARAYGRGCRCLICKRAWSLRMKRYRCGLPYTDDAHVPTVGAARRLQALAVCGWSATDLAALLGTDKQNVAKWRNNQRAYMMRSTHDKIAAVYDQVWDKPPPGPYPVKVKRLAAAHGWVSPLAWDDIDDPAERPWCPHQERGLHAADDGLDDIAIAEAMRGRPVRLTSAERAEAVQRMTARGYSAQVIAERLNVTQRCVVRRRTATGTERVA